MAEVKYYKVISFSIQSEKCRVWKEIKICLQIEAEQLKKKSVRSKKKIETEFKPNHHNCCTKITKWKNKVLHKILAKVHEISEIYANRKSVTFLFKHNREEEQIKNTKSETDERQRENKSATNKKRCLQRDSNEMDVIMHQREIVFSVSNPSPLPQNVDTAEMVFVLGSGRSKSYGD